MSGINKHTNCFDSTRNVSRPKSLLLIHQMALSIQSLSNSFLNLSYLLIKTKMSYLTCPVRCRIRTISNPSQRLSTPTRPLWMCLIRLIPQAPRSPSVKTMLLSSRPRTIRILSQLNIWSMTSNKISTH